MEQNIDGKCGLTAGACSPGILSGDVNDVNYGTAKQRECKGIGDGSTAYCHLQHLTEGRGCTSTTACNTAYNGPTACTNKGDKKSCEGVGAYLATPINNLGTATYFSCSLNTPFTPKDGYRIVAGCSSCCKWGEGTERCLLNGSEISNSYCSGLK